MVGISKFRAKSGSASCFEFGREANATRASRAEGELVKTGYAPVPRSGRRWFRVGHVLAFARYRCEARGHPRLIAQPCGLEGRTTRSGKDSIDHAPGAHDDIANTLAGALVRVRGFETRYSPFPPQPYQP